MSVVPDESILTPRSALAGERATNALPGQYVLWLAGSSISQLGDAVLYFALAWAASGIGGAAAGLVLKLAAALAAVRFAMSDDPELPALGGVLVDYDGDVLRVVASDRYRLAVATVAVRTRRGPAVRVIAPRSLVEQCTLLRDREVSLRLDPRAVHVGDRREAGIDAAFPDYERILRTTHERCVTATAADLVVRLLSGPSRALVTAPNEVAHDVSILLPNDDGMLEIVAGDDPDAVGFNREFLLEAIDAAAVGGCGQLELALGGPITPLAIRNPLRPGDVSLLMPTRLD